MKFDKFLLKMRAVQPREAAGLPQREALFLEKHQRDFKPHFVFRKTGLSRFFFRD